MAEEKQDSDAVKAVKAALAELHPDPLPPPNAEVLRRPLDLSDKSPVARPPKEKFRMSDSSQLNGQYRALETRVDDLKSNYHDLRVDMDGRFNLLSKEIAKNASDTNVRLDRLMELSGNKSDVTKYGSVLAVVAALMTSVIGGFVTLENNSINSSIGSLATNMDKTIVRIEGQVTSLQTTTIPRPELDGRINSNHMAIQEVVRTQDDHSRQIATATADAANLKADVERMKGDIVTRRENEGHWSDLSNRVDLLSNRLTEAIKASGGGDIGDQLKQLRDQVNDFQRKFIAVPAFPKYNDK